MAEALSREREREGGGAKAEGRKRKQQNLVNRWQNGENRNY